MGCAQSSSTPEVVQPTNVDVTINKPCRYGANCKDHTAKHRSRYTHPAPAPTRPLAPAPAPPVSSLKLTCKYGAACYDLSDKHRAKFSHPNQGFSRAAGKPMCRHGEGCHRHNPLHWSSFDHPQSHPFLKAPPCKPCKPDPKAAPKAAPAPSSVVRFKDPTFPPHPTSLGVDRPATWMRPEAIVGKGAVLFDQIEPNDVMQGTLGDCWLMASFSAVAGFYGIVRQRFGYPNSGALRPDDKYEVSLFSHRMQAWEIITIDARIPCESHAQSPCQRTCHQTWASTPRIAPPPPPLILCSTPTAVQSLRSQTGTRCG